MIRGFALEHASGGLLESCFDVLLEEVVLEGVGEGERLDQSAAGDV